jgi:hypothetical protein
VQFASSYERVTWIGLPKYASYDPTNAGVNIASNTLACFSARLGLLPLPRPGNNMPGRELGAG